MENWRELERERVDNIKKGREIIEHYNSIDHIYIYMYMYKLYKQYLYIHVHVHGTISTMSL